MSDLPADRAPAAITGTIVYTPADLQLLRAQFGRATPMELWQSILVAGGFGAVIGYGAGAITGFSSTGPWLAAAGAIAATTAWSWYLHRAIGPVQSTKPQTVTIDPTGLRLTTPNADTLMRWPLFTQRLAFADHIALKTEDNTWVMLRSGYFASAADYAAAVELIEAKVG